MQFVSTGVSPSGQFGKYVPPQIWEHGSQKSEEDEEEDEEPHVQQLISVSQSIRVASSPFGQVGVVPKSAPKAPHL